MKAIGGAPSIHQFIATESRAGGIDEAYLHLIFAEQLLCDLVVVDADRVFLVGESIVGDELVNDI